MGPKGTPRFTSVCSGEDPHGSFFGVLDRKGFIQRKVGNFVKIKGKKLDWMELIGE